MKLDVSIKGMSSALKTIEARTTNLKALGKEITSKLADEGEKIATDKFASADYAGINDVTVSSDEIDGGHRVVAEGSQVLFIEYGTGKKQAEHPTGKYTHGSMYTTKMAIGKDAWLYPARNGQGKGGYAMPSEVYKGLLYTKGVPAQNCMYDTEHELRELVTDVAKEVLKKK